MSRLLTSDEQGVFSDVVLSLHPESSLQMQRTIIDLVSRVAEAQRDLSDKDWIEWIEGDESNTWMKDGDTATVMVCLSKDAWQARKKEVSK